MMQTEREAIVNLRERNRILDDQNTALRARVAALVPYACCDCGLRALLAAPEPEAMMADDLGQQRDTLTPRLVEAWAVLTAERDALRAALRRYGRHTIECASKSQNTRVPVGCDCGLDALLAKYEAQP